MKGLGRPFLIIFLILVLVVAAFIYYYVRASALIASADAATYSLNVSVSNLQSQLSSANAQVSAFQNQINTAYSQLASAQGQLSTANATISSLQSQVSSYKSQAASLQSEVDSYKSQLSSIQNDVNSYKSQIASLQGQLTAANAANITALEAQVVSLQQQNQNLTDITNLKNVLVVTDALTVNQQYAAPYTIGTFTAPYAGYITIGGQTTSPDIYITVTDSFPNYPVEARYQFGTGTTLNIPVLPGTVTVYYHNANGAGISTGTVGVRYYY
ncbi:MAG: hypothetical protein Q7R57_03375 [Dehalococcoidales bacterium]|nr:hypothetical protein [Dehalococcoidales bacterium]